jgi:murein L,D-transpeptidase YafK
VIARAPSRRLAPPPLAAAALLALALASPLAYGDDDASEMPAAAFPNEVEAALVRAITGLKLYGLGHALGEIDHILARAPNFRLGHLIRGDLLMARAGNPVAFGPTASVVASARTAPLQDEARVRLKRFLDAPPADHLPLPVLQLAPGHEHAILVDTTRSRLFVFANAAGAPRLVTDFYVSVGKNGVEKQREGDQKTPLGVYTIVSSKEKLPDFYGPGAFPISYPNEWDRQHGRGGHGIWLHGTPSETYSRPPRATDGCIVLANEDLNRLAKYVRVGHTPVVVASGVEWVEPGRWAESRRDFLAAFEQWRADWESLDTDRYLSHYSRQFKVDGKDLAAWGAHKRKVNAGKSWVKVGVANVSLFGLAEGEDTLVVTFEQDYKSSNLANRTHKRQYWSREGGRWRILFETVVS